MDVDWDNLLSQYPISSLDFDPTTELEAADFFLMEFKYLNPELSTTKPVNGILESQQITETQVTRQPACSTDGHQIPPENAAPVKVLRQIVKCPPIVNQSTNENDGVQVLFHGGPIAKENSKITKTARIGILRKTVTYQSK